MTAAFVSVIIPTYNRAHLLPRSIRSVLDAVADEDEVIVVDDGSTDTTEQAVASFGARVRYLRTPNGGPGVARNVGVRAATRPLIAFHDSDDAWMPDKLRLQRMLMQARPEVLFCFSNFGVRTADGQERRFFLQEWYADRRPWEEILTTKVPFSSLGELPPGRSDFWVYLGDLYPHALERCYLSAFTLLVRREPAGEALYFGEAIRFYEDRECFIRLARAGRAAYLDCETAWQYEHAGPRVTDVSTFDRATCDLTVMDRTFGNDPHFLAEHGERYRRYRKTQHLIRARCFLLQGDTEAARTELKHLDGGPLAYRLLAAMPGRLTRGLLAARRVLQRA